MVNRNIVDCHVEGGFTLTELIIVIVVLGLLAAVAGPSIGDMITTSRVKATESELQALKLAIVGNPRVVAGGQYINVGYEGDVGHLPESLPQLGARMGGDPTYDNFTRIGWNGSYIDTSGGDYLLDAWDSLYIYDSTARTIRSVGGSDTITISF